MSGSIKYIDPIEVSSTGEGTGDWCLVDVRTPAEFRESHIKGSHNLPLGGLADHVETIRTFARQSPVALLCRTSRRAKEAAKILEEAGLKSACVVDGGVVGWEELGFPLVRGKKGMSLERQVRVAAGSLVVLGVALGVLVHPGFLAIAGFVGAGLVFAGLTDTCGMAMLLGKMPWNRLPTACPTEARA